MKGQNIKNKVVFLPLDERPCNYKFPFDIFRNSNLNIRRPNKELMGDKKKPADFENIKKFLLNESKDADALIIAIDTLLYGGIIPSRLHCYKKEELLDRIEVIRKIKTQNPKIIIYAYHLIMRTPQYNSSDEEPDYYEYVGEDIFNLGFLGHKKELGIINSEELLKFESIKIKEKYLNDFLNRRKINLSLTKKSVEFVNKGIIDFLIIPQDDAAEFGFTAKDQEEIRIQIRKFNISNSVYMYPGADEVANNLLARLSNKLLNVQPKIYIKYNSLSAPWTIPSLEDRYLDTTIKYQILACGAIPSTNMKDADILLYVNAPSDKMITAPYQFELKGRGFTVLRNMVEFIESIKYALNTLKKPVILADLAFGNGGDVELLRMLNKENILMDLAAYSGWNTSANSLGTALAQGLVYANFGKTKEHLNFLVLRYVEDVGYCALVRRKVTENDLTPNGFNYFDVKESEGLIAEVVRKYLTDFIRKELTSIKDNISLDKVYMPWRRMYEVGLEITYKEGMKK
ncbi:MAG: DUF4127 family protein [Acholeplasmatales bacterium]